MRVDPVLADTERGPSGSLLERRAGACGASVPEASRAVHGPDRGGDRQIAGGVSAARPSMSRLARSVFLFYPHQPCDLARRQTAALVRYAWLGYPCTVGDAGANSVPGTGIRPGCPSNRIFCGEPILTLPKNAPLSDAAARSMVIEYAWRMGRRFAMLTARSLDEVEPQLRALLAGRKENKTASAGSRSSAPCSHN